MALLKLINAPGSIGFLLLCLVIGLVMRYVWPRRLRLARWWFAAVLLGYLLLAMPVVANTIARALPAVSARSGPSPGTLVVFDGDNRRGRVRQAAAAYHSVPQSVIWVLGEQWVVDALIEAGIPEERISHDATTLTTRDQVAAADRIGEATGGGRIGIVASRLQMPRVAALVRARSLDVVLLASPVDDEPATTGRDRYVPRYIALRVSRDVLYEHAALAYYRWRGWI